MFKHIIVYAYSVTFQNFGIDECKVMLLILTAASCIPNGTASMLCYKKLIYFHFSLIVWSRDSSVSIATCYRLDGPGIESQWGVKFSAPVQTGSEAHPTSCTMGTGSLSWQ